ncbi:oxygenase MpaB family protein [Agromyces aerolatus]|uniref:oxygenase MpaB family protein n=1 Tax=Agromyces sp. LY-1074 TaxID=3074080 RepID=UPI002860A283|nr:MULTISPECIES: oxygenase MpaB family protein [unclassified Agromyces]MDR5700052.1 oxygenase MpaB family protein [Agromyces sp. LY-1074]MDR5706580.1 oxygenase MpaB family protein [Agromyces sp. LY-1358]
MPTLDADALIDAAFTRHAADALILAGGGAAILLQLADPRIARGVARHSAFREDPMRRLFGTLDYVYAVASGDERLLAATVADVNGRHRPVRGPAEASGPAYSAFDRDLQRYVASTLTAVGLRLEERLGGPLDPVLADGFVARYGRLASALQGGAAGWPESRAGFDAWWHDRVATLAVGGDARDVARALLTSRSVPLWLRAGQPVLRLVTAALLPDSLRSAYGFRWTARTERIANAWLDALAAARVVVPAPIRAVPMRRSLSRMSRRLDQIG